MRWIPPRRPILAAVLASATALGAASASAPALAAAPATTLDPLAQPQQFQAPGNEVRPQMRWWWGSIIGRPSGALSVSETKREVAAMADAGFGSFEIAFSGSKWATPEQRENLEAALEEARDRGMHVDMTIGASWPVRTPNTAPGSGLSLQELQYGRSDLAGGATFDGPVPNPYDDAANGRGARLFAVTAAKVVEDGPAVTRVDEAPASSTVLDPTSLIDLTADVDSSGALRWTAPAGGRWIVFGFWQRDARQGVIDHFNDEAVTAAGRYVDDNQFTDVAARLLRVHGGSFFEDSLEINAEGLFWNDEMAGQFARRRGYDVRRFLPLFFQQGMNKYWIPQDPPPADFELPAAQGERIRHDYYETLTDLYVDEHLQPFQDWASEHGVKFRTQAAFGQDLDVTRSARELAQAGGLPDDESLNAGDKIPADQAGNRESWRFALDHHRLVSGGSHQGGNNEISSELGAQFLYAFQMDLAGYKSLLDKEWAAGTSRATVHGFSYQTSTARWPGDMAFDDYVADSWNPDFPQWGDWKALNDYWARGTSVLEAGTARADVALYRDGFVTTAAQGLGVTPQMRPLFDAEKLERAGYGVEFLDPNGVLDEDADGTGVLYPHGPRYKAIVIDERKLPAAVAEKLAVEAEQGLAVVLVGDLPDADTSYKNATRGDRRVAAAIDRLLAAPKVARVGTQAEAAGALAALGVTPDAKWAAPAQLLTQHRETKSADYFYLYNATNEAISVDGSFASSGRPYALNLWSGAIDPVAAFSQAGGRTTVPLKVPALGTAVIAFRKGEAAPALHAVASSGGELVVKDDSSVELRDTAAGTDTVTVADGSTRSATIGALPAALSPTSWRLHVAGESALGTTPYDLQLDALKDWRELPGLAGVSGVGTYTTTLDVPADWSAADRGAYLDLGTVSGSVRVALNGSTVAPDSVAGRRWDVSALLKPGANELTVRLATTLRNAVPRILVPAASQQYGLLGPVRLVPFGRATVDLRTPVTPPPVERPPVVTPPAPRRPSTKVTVTAGKTIRLAGLTRTGLLVRVTVPQRAKLALTLSAKLPSAKRTTALARASRSTTKPATVSLRLKAGRAAARKLKLALKAKKSVTATVAVKTTLAGGKPATKTLRITIRR